jgi:hypothetical protein
VLVHLIRNIKILKRGRREMMGLGRRGNGFFFPS